MESKTPTSLAYLDAFFPDVPALQTQLDFETALREVGFGVRRQRTLRLYPPLAFNVRRVLGRTVRNLAKRSGSKLLCLMMGPAAYRLVPDGIMDRCSLYCWDTWPDNYKVWDSLLIRFKTEIAFFSSRQARDRFQARFPAMRCYWIPEGCAPEFCCPDKTLKSRSIDVLELGRRYERYHDAITPGLFRAGFNHRYQKSGGEIVFPGRKALLEGLADSKVCICFPASLTNPARGTIETATSRYFEAMASGCLIVGHCPAELQDLVGYNPVVEADLDNAANQIQAIISTIEDYQPLVQKNFERVLTNGMWVHRAQAAKKILEAETEGVPQEDFQR